MAYFIAINAIFLSSFLEDKLNMKCDLCDICMNWTTSSFNHGTSYTFSLTVVHIELAYSTSYSTTYNSIPTTCDICHPATYNTTITPIYSVKSFPGIFETCDLTTDRISSTFNFTAYFPITCRNYTVNCETKANSYTVFSCLTTACHKMALHISKESAV